jgi:hypothetical protein
MVYRTATKTGYRTPHWMNVLEVSICCMVLVHLCLQSLTQEYAGHVMSLLCIPPLLTAILSCVALLLYSFSWNKSSSGCKRWHNETTVYEDFMFECLYVLKHELHCQLKMTERTITEILHEKLSL